MVNEMFNEQDKEALLAVLATGNLHMGKEVKKFETAFAAAFGVKHAIAVSSGAAGMHMALMVAALSPTEEVLVPPLAPVGGPNAVFHQGGVNIFADVDPKTGNVDLKDLFAHLHDQTKGIILHHYGGHPMDVSAVMERVKDKDIPVIVDASHALGGEYQGRSVAALGDIVVFDFGPFNQIYLGEGGMITTNSDENAQWLRLFRDEGFVKDPHLLTKDQGPWHYEMQDLGYSYRMTELQAALGYSQLQRLEQTLVKRRQVASIYSEGLAKVKEITLPIEENKAVSAWGFYPVLLDPLLVPKRRKIFVQLKMAGVSVDVRYYPVFLHPYYLWAGHPDVCTLSGSRAPLAEAFYQRVLLLPINEKIDEKKATMIKNKVRQIVANNL